MRLPSPALPIAVLALALQAYGLPIHEAAERPAQEPAGRPTAAGAPLRPLALPDQLGDLAELRARDRLLEFPPSAGERALADLARPELSPQDRATALLALGCSRLPSGRGMLESWAAEGSVAERRAAVLGLGEMGSGGTALLEGVLGGSEPELFAPALLALLRGGASAGRQTVERLAATGGEDLAPIAAELLLAELDPEATPPVGILRTLLDLRWRAARSYGLVDGQGWQAALLDDLCADSDFLDAVVLRHAATLPRPGVRDHFQELLLGGAGLERIRGAVAAMPVETAQLIRLGLWTPTDGTAEWAALLEGIERARVERPFAEVLRVARLLPGHGTHAASLLVRTGDRAGLPLLELDLEAEDPAVRAGVVEALAASKVEKYILDLERLREDPSARVRAAALVGQVRLGYEVASRGLEEELDDAEHPDRDELIDALCRSVRDQRVLPIALDRFGELTGDRRLRMAIALTAAGKLGEVRDVVREALAGEGGAAHPQAIEMVRGLSRNAGPEDVAALRGVFPVPGELELNVELGLALLHNGDPIMLQPVREALWKGSWNRSILAAAVLIDLAGMETLRSEARRPPGTVSLRDLRRIGFALGEWGGLPEVERLARRSSSRDPVLQGALLGALAARTQ